MRQQSHVATVQLRTLILHTVRRTACHRDKDELFRKFCLLYGASTRRHRQFSHSDIDCKQHRVITDFHSILEQLFE